MLRNELTFLSSYFPVYFIILIIFARGCKSAKFRNRRIFLNLGGIIEWHDVVCMSLIIILVTPNS